jgi:hypothetical protein
MLQAAHLQTMQLQKQLEDRTQDNQTKLEVAKIQSASRESAAAISHPHGLDPMHEHTLKAHEIALKHEATMQELEAELKKFVVEQMAKMEMHRDKIALDNEKLQFQAKHAKKSEK